MVPSPSLNDSTKPQIETNHDENATEFPYYWRLRHSRRERRIWAEQHCSTETAAKHGNPNENEGGNFLLILFTGIMAFGTIGMAIVIYYQYQNSRESSEKQLRAYIYVEPRPPGPRHNWGGVVIKNGGQTPAHDVRAWIKVGRCPREKICSITLEPGTFVLQPPIHMSRDEAFFLEPKGTLTFFEGSKPENNDPMIYWGEIRYTDAFRKAHITEFRLGVEWMFYDHFKGDVWEVTTVCPGSKYT